jgi:hypothetical protein
MVEFERRLKRIGTFGNAQTAGGDVNLLLAYLRTTPGTDGRGSRKHRNGLSRLECAGADLPAKDWLPPAPRTGSIVKR